MTRTANPIRLQPLSAATIPQVRDLAARWKLHRAGRDWRGSCPCCGYGADAFCLIESKGRVLAWCASCQDRQALAALLRGSAAAARDPDPGFEAGKRAAAVRRRDLALKLWAGAAPAYGTPAAAYLASRGLRHVASSKSLRWRRDCPHPAERGRLPALLGLVVNAGGEPIAVHRTFLRHDGATKAGATPTKATLGGVWTGAIRLDPLAAELVVGEGIESSASAGLLLGLPAWAAISAGNLATGLVLPEVVRSIVVAVDHDPPGQRAATQAVARWRAEGRRVRWFRPDQAGADCNDVLLAGGASHA